MTLFMRPNEFHADDRADYTIVNRDVLGNELRVGRIYSNAGPDGMKWTFAVDGWGSDLADTLQEAKDRFQAVLDRVGFGLGGRA